MSDEASPLPSCHVFIAQSLDGFIARPDGDIDWLLARDTSREDHGYTQFMARIDAIVMGRGTYEKVVEFDPWPYERPVVVLSGSLAEDSVPERLVGKVRILDRSPQEALAGLHAEGCRRLYVDGGKLIQSFLRRGLIDDLVVTVVPVLLGAGRPLFGAVDSDVSLAHESTVSFPSGLVQSRYRVLR
jgi:dihydrofolate reductase